MGGGIGIRYGTLRGIVGTHESFVHSPEPRKACKVTIRVRINSANLCPIHKYFIKKEL